LEAVPVPAASPVTFAFNTGTEPNGIIFIAEWADQPLPRRATLSDRPGGPPVGPGCETGGVSLSFNYFVGVNRFAAYYPTLQPNATYYITVQADQAGTVFVDWH
jgi:hypothetical protein